MKLNAFTVVEISEGDIIGLSCFPNKTEAEELMMAQVAENTGMDEEAEGFKDYVEECQSLAIEHGGWSDMEGNYTVSIIESK